MRKQFGSEPQPTTALEQRAHQMLREWPLKTAMLYGLWLKQEHRDSEIYRFTDAWLQWRVVESVDTADPA